MQIFLYEFITGGGLLFHPTEAVPASLLAEGRAMIAALAADFAAVDDVRLVLIQDHRFPWPAPAGSQTVVVSSVAEHEAAFDHAATESDATLLIAPELDNHLLDRCQRVFDLGGRLLSPRPGIVRLTSDKQATAEHLADAGIAVPEGRSLAPGQAPPEERFYPALRVLKPRFGAGSQQTHSLILRSWDDHQTAPRLDCPGRIEEFCPGDAVSVALLCGPAGNTALPPCRQHLLHGDFTYMGGSLPLEPALVARAERLARAAVETLSDVVGYVGVDLVLGEEPGDRDVVIEINARVTTSYVGLRAAAAPGTNLARAMLDVAEGRQPELSFRPVHVEFDPDGTIRETAPLECGGPPPLSAEREPGVNRPERSNVPAARDRTGTPSQPESGDRPPHSKDPRETA